MNSKKNAGILGLGSFLPEEVRRNDWWPPELVASWRAGRGSKPLRCPDSITNPGTRATFAAEAALDSDPFAGAVERRVMKEGMLPSEMEEAAAREAIANAGIDKSQIDLLLTHSSVPDYLSTTNAFALQARLGLSDRTCALAVEATCVSFLHQMILAEQMIVSGRARYALLVQSCTASRLSKKEAPYSMRFGDGATAVVIGPVPASRGILGYACRTDGTKYDAIVTGVPGAEWYSEGRLVGYIRDPAKAMSASMTLTELGKPIMDEALAKAQVKPEEIEFYGGHQGSSYLRRVTQEYFELRNARHVDTYAWTGSLSSACIPLCLQIGQREGSIKDGNLVAIWSAGAGFAWSAMVLRWGGAAD